MDSFGDAERKILNYFEKGTKFEFLNDEFEVELSGKPTCMQGEPKTDIYVLASNDNKSEEIKISYKKENADFLENKTNADRAEQIFGDGWRSIIEESTTGIADRFLDRMRIYKDRINRTKKGAITLGWKFELVNKPSGELSGKLHLTKEQLFDVYAGSNLSADKRDATVNGTVVENSGVANYILVTDDVESAQDVIGKMISIEDYISLHPDIYFACKALNYRTFEEKYDGNRPLAVQVDWFIQNDKLSSEIIFDKPLELNGDEMARRLLRCLEYLNIKTTDDITDQNTDKNSIKSHLEEEL